MNKEARFCVYLHKIGTEVKYVGSGSLDRPKGKNSRSDKWWSEIGNKDYNIIVVKKNLTKHEAVELEIRLYYKYKNTLVNRNPPSHFRSLDQELEIFNEWLNIDSSSPSGLSWKKTGAGKGAMAKKQGEVAGTLTPVGYWQVRLLGNTYRCHRIIVVLRGDKIPYSYVVNHIDSNKSNNLTENLEVITQQQNILCCKIRQTNIYKVKGISEVRQKTGRVTGYRVTYLQENGVKCREYFGLRVHGTLENCLSSAIIFRKEKETNAYHNRTSTTSNTG